jgi:hypothetical protein
MNILNENNNFLTSIYFKLLRKIKVNLIKFDFLKFKICVRGGSPYNYVTYFSPCMFMFNLCSVFY